MFSNSLYMYSLVDLFDMYKISPIFFKFREYTPRQKKSLHQNLSILKLLLTAERPLSIYKIHIRLISKEFEHEVSEIESGAGTELGKPKFAYVWRLVNGLGKEGLIGEAKGKRKARLFSLRLKGFFLCVSEGYASREEIRNYISRVSMFSKILFKLFPEWGLELSETLLSFVVTMSVSVLLATSLGVKPFSFLEDGREEEIKGAFWEQVEIFLFQGLLTFAMKGASIDYEKLTSEEKDILKRKWKLFAENFSKVLELYELSTRLYKEKVEQLK